MINKLNISNNRICLDADGVLVNFHIMFEKALFDFFSRDFPKFNQPNTGWVNNWNLAIQFGISEKQLESVWNYIYDNEKYLETPFYPGVEEKILELINAGFEIYIVTSIDEKASNARVKQFAKLHPEITVHCVGLDQSKLPLLESIDPLVFVDDRYINIRSAIEAKIPEILWINDGLFGECYKDPKVIEFSNFINAFNYIENKYMKDVLENSSPTRKL
jgi:FMN phosphatase YigB (HAD superfamily)